MHIYFQAEDLRFEHRPALCFLKIKVNITNLIIICLTYKVVDIQPNIALTKRVVVRQADARNMKISNTYSMRNRNSHMLF